MTKTFCDQCGKDITNETKEIPIKGDRYAGSLCKPSFDTPAGVRIYEDICWHCVLIQFTLRMEEVK